MEGGTIYIYNNERFLKNLITKTKWETILN